MVYGALNMGSVLATAMNDDSTASYYTSIAEGIKAAFTTTFWDADAGLFRDDETATSRRYKNDTDNPYSDALSTTDANLVSLVKDSSIKKPCFRTTSYAFPKWPWLTNFLLDDALLAKSLRSSGVRDGVQGTVIVSGDCDQY